MNTQTVILLVEDSADDEMLTKRAFLKQQILNPMVVCRDGAEALDYFLGADGAKNLSGRTHLVLLDLNLPKVSGLEVLAQLRANPATALMPIIVLTSSDEDTDLREAYRLGANSYIRKPVDFNSFANVAAQIGPYWLVVNPPPPVAA